MMRRYPLALKCFPPSSPRSSQSARPKPLPLNAETVIGTMTGEGTGIVIGTVIGAVRDRVTGIAPRCAGVSSTTTGMSV